MALSTTYYISCRDYKMLICSIKRPKSPRPLGSTFWLKFDTTSLPFHAYPHYVTHIDQLPPPVMYLVMITIIMYFQKIKY